MAVYRKADLYTGAGCNEFLVLMTSFRWQWRFGAAMCIAWGKGTYQVFGSFIACEWRDRARGKRVMDVWLGVCGHG